MSLPNTWTEARLTPLLSALETGGRPMGGVGEIESGTPSISGEHFGWNGEFDFSKLKYIPDDYFRKLQTGIVEVGDILVVKDGATTAKCAYVNEFFPFEKAAINEHVFLLRGKHDLLNSRFLFEILRSEFGKQQILKSYRGAAIGGIPRDFTDHVKLLIPTLPEQQRIVDVLQQSELVLKAKKSISEQIDQLIRTSYWEYFGDWYTADGLVNPVRISECVANSQYGVSEAMEESGTNAVLRMNSITTSGWLDLSDLKYASLSKKDIESTKLLDGDLLFNRTNSKELVGKCAIWRPTAREFSFASYLVRLRLKPKMLPEFLWATLNSAYGKYRLLNSAKQAVSMANVSPTDLGRITVPLPPLTLQEGFAKFVQAVEEIRTQILGNLDVFEELHNVVSQQALIGDLTTKWRADHTAEIAQAALARDTLLREHGAKIKLPTNDVALAITEAELPTQSSRQWLFEELGEFQRQVLAAFIEYCQQSDKPLLVEDPEVFARFCDDSLVVERLESFGESLGNRIRRTLSQLAALGLIAKVTLPKHNQETGELDYLKAFRPLRPDEHTRMADLQSIRNSLSPPLNYYFTAQVDYETSERAGAGGMFQVISIEDDDGKDFTYLVDQGKHYASEDALKMDIASALKVGLHQVELEVV